MLGWFRVSSPGPDNPNDNEEAAAHIPVRSGLFCEIREEWDKAEEVIKLAEQVTADVVIPAIQELRYAGRRLVDGLNAAALGEPDDRVVALLEDARFSCHRARHDAIDAAITLMSIDADILARQMGYNIVHNSFPDYLNFVERLDEARNHIAESRRNRADRDAIYTAITADDFPGLVNDYKALRRSETLMRIIVGAKKIGFWVTVVIAIFGYALSWYFWAYPRQIAPAGSPQGLQSAAPPSPQNRQRSPATPSVAGIRPNGARTTTPAPHP